MVTFIGIHFRLYTCGVFLNVQTVKYLKSTGAPPATFDIVPGSACKELDLDSRQSSRHRIIPTCPICFQTRDDELLLGRVVPNDRCVCRGFPVK